MKKWKSEVIRTGDSVIGVKGLLERMKKVSKGTSEVPVHKCTQPGKLQEDQVRCV